MSDLLLPGAVEPIPTRVGWSLAGDHFWFGRLVCAEMAGRISLAQLFADAVGGGTLAPEALAVIDDVASVVCAADPRIWPLKLGRVVASYGNVLPAIAATQLACDNDNIGPVVCGSAAQLLADWMAELGTRAVDAVSVEGAVMRRLERGELLQGYGVPLRDEDERLVALRACMARRGRDRLPFWSLMDRASEVLYRARRVRPNIGTGISAAFLDVGLTPVQVGHLAVALFHHLFVANAVEGAAQAPAVLRRLPVTAVSYQGAPARRSPRAEG